MMDTDGVYREWCASLAKWSGRSAESVVGRHWSECGWAPAGVELAWRLEDTTLPDSIQSESPLLGEGVSIHLRTRTDNGAIVGREAIAIGKRAVRRPAKTRLTISERLGRWATWFNDGTARLPWLVAALGASIVLSFVNMPTNSVCDLGDLVDTEYVVAVESCGGE